MLPDTPTLHELGVTQFEVGAWLGLLAPAGTPKPIIDKLAKDISEALKQPDVVQKMNELGSTVVGNRPEEFRQFLNQQIDMWAEGVKISGATVD